MKKKKIINQILYQIKHSELVYDQASKSVHSTVIKNELSEVKKKRKQYLIDLMKEFYNRRKSTQNLGVIGTFVTKIWLKLNDLFVHRNVPYILITCVAADKELLNCYERAKKYKLNEKLSNLIIQQRSEIQLQANDFQKRINKYPWL
jgi:hypothetical protein